MGLDDCCRASRAQIYRSQVLCEVVCDDYEKFICSVCPRSDMHVAGGYRGKIPARGFLFLLPDLHERVLCMLCDCSPIRMSVPLVQRGLHSSEPDHLVKEHMNEV